MTVRVKKPARVVLDTNIVLSALIFAKGRLSFIRSGWHQASYQALVSKSTIAELMRVLSHPKFKLSAEEQHELLSDYLAHCTTVRIPAITPKTPPCRDPFDVQFLQLAVVGKADYLVTGDRDLLALADEFSCAIVTAEEFQSRLA